MRVEVLQAAALCFYGNCFLSQNGEASAPELLGKNSTFRTVYDVEFNRASTRSMAAPSGTLTVGTARWYKRLRNEGVQSLRLHLPIFRRETPKPNSWGIITDGNSGLEIWSASKIARVTRFDAKTPWKFDYTAHRFSRWSLDEPLTLDEAKARFDSALLDVVKLMRKQSEENRDRFEAIAQACQLPFFEIPDFGDVVRPKLPPTIKKQALLAIWVVDELTKGSIEESDELVPRALDELWKATMRTLETVASYLPAVGSCVDGVNCQEDSAA